MKTLSLILAIGGMDILLFTLTPSDGITRSATGISVLLMYLGITMIASGICVCLAQFSKKYRSKDTIAVETTITNQPISKPIVETESVYSMRCIRILDYTAPKSAG